MVDILGPADAANAVTVRPADGRSFSSLDSWFKDCTSPTSEDGTEIQAAFLNGAIAALRAVWRGNGGTVADPTIKIVPELGTDDNGLLKAIQHMIQRGQPQYAVDSGSANALVVTLSPAAVEYKAGMTVRVKVAASCTGASTINVNGLGAKSIKRRDGSALIANDLVIGEVAELIYDGTNFYRVGFDTTVIPILTANRDYYVNDSTGNDSNAGTSGGSPFKTIQKAIDVVSKLNANGFAVTINVADGTYTPFSLSVAINGTLTVVGNVTTPANCIISTNSGSACVNARGVGTTVKMRGFKITNTATGGHGLLPQAGGNIDFDLMVFDFCNGAHVFCDFGSASVFGNYTIVGNANWHVLLNHGSFILTPSSPNTITLTGSPVFLYFVKADDLSFVRANNTTTFSGAAGGGTRYIVTANSAVQTGGAGGSFLPGSTPGSTATGGQYI